MLLGMQDFDFNFVQFRSSPTKFAQKQFLLGDGCISCIPSSFGTVILIFLLWYRPNGISGKRSVSDAGGMGLKSRTDQFFHTLPTTRNRCNLAVWALAQSRGVGHRSLVTPERILS